MISYAITKGKMTKQIPFHEQARKLIIGLIEESYLKGKTFCLTPTFYY